MWEGAEMDTLDTPWCWHYLADCGRWHRFEVNFCDCYLFSQSVLWGIAYTLVSVPAGWSTQSRQERGPWKVLSNKPQRCFKFIVIQLQQQDRLLRYLHFLLRFMSSPAWLTRFLDPCAAMLQTDLNTGRQRRILRGYNIERRWNPSYNGKCYEEFTRLPFIIISGKMKVKLTQLNCFLSQLLLLHGSPCVLGNGWTHMSISGEIMTIMIIITKEIIRMIITIIIINRDDNH